MFGLPRTLILITLAVTLVLASVPRCGNFRAILKALSIVDVLEKEHCHQEEVKTSPKLSKITTEGCECVLVKWPLLAVNSYDIEPEHSLVSVFMFENFFYFGQLLERPEPPRLPPPRIS